MFLSLYLYLFVTDAELARSVRTAVMYIVANLSLGNIYISQNSVKESWFWIASATVGKKVSYAAFSSCEI